MLRWYNTDGQNKCSDGVISTSERAGYLSAITAPVEITRYVSAPIICSSERN
jgi:hypothetical protein